MVKDVAPLPGYPEPYGLLCAMLQDATYDWRAELPGEVPAEAVIWRVRPDGPSIGAIMLHMIVVEIFWIELFVLKRQLSEEDWRLLLWDQIDVDEPRWPDPHVQPLAWYSDLHDRIRVRTLDAIKEWPLADTHLEREGEDNLYTPRWVLQHVVQHETYHGGQIVMLHDLWRRSRG